MTPAAQPADTGSIDGYTYGTSAASRSPLSLGELELLKQAADLTEDDERYLSLAGDVLADQAEAMVDTWRSVLGEHAHLAYYSAHTDGTPNPDYSAASKPRFVQWVLDVCTRPYDQDWLDYQHEIGLRHTRAKKNRTDDVDSAEHIPLRYVLAFTPVVISTARRFLSAKGHSDDDVEHMHTAWTKAVMLHVILWSRAYTADDNW